MARRHGIPTPVNDELHRLICLKQSEYYAGSPV
jgi:ketopantoate reductase